MNRDSGDPPGEPEEATSIIDLSDRRPTPKEVPAFALERVAAEKAVAEDPRTLAYQEAMKVFHEPPADLEALLLRRLLELVLPEMRRYAFPSIRGWLREARSTTQERLVQWEKQLGTRPAQMLREPWMSERAYKIAGLHFLHGMIGAQKGDSGLVLGAELYLLADGRLARVEPLGHWKLSGEQATRSVTSIGHAQLIEPDQATHFFPLAYMVERLRALLWYLPQGEPLAPAGEDLEERRERFVALVQELSRATSVYKQQLRRVAFSLG